MTGKMADKIVGYKYSLGMHLILCQEADALLGVTAGDRVLLGWTNSQFGSPADSLPANWGRSFGESDTNEGTTFMRVAANNNVDPKFRTIYQVRYNAEERLTIIPVVVATEVNYEKAIDYFESSRRTKMTTSYDSASKEWVLIKERITSEDAYVKASTSVGTLAQQLPIDPVNNVKYSPEVPDFMGFGYDKFFTFTPPKPAASFAGFSTLGWSGNQTVYLSKPELFGGSLRTGGITGDMALLFGGDDQIPNTYLASFFKDGEGENWCPAFKGVVSVVMERVYIGTSPYLQNWAFLLRKIPYCSYKEFARLVDWKTGKFVGNIDPAADHRIGVIQASDHHYDANPAYIIKACITSPSYGMGYPEPMIGESFDVAAKQLYREGFGLSLIWDTQSSVSDFIQIVLNHINGVIYVARDTGMFEIKLLRADYTLEDNLVNLNTSNVIRMDNFQRIGWGETVNEIVLQYSNRVTGTSDAITVQDLANIQTQGMVVSATKTYQGIHDSELAARVAQRDLQTFSTPLSKVKLIANREASSLRAGDVFVLTWPPLEIQAIVYRVGSISLGTLLNGEVVIEAVEDVFALPVASYIGKYATPVARPSTVDIKITEFILREACFFDVIRHAGASNISAFSSDSSWVMGAAARPYSEAASFAVDIFIDGSDENINKGSIDDIAASEQLSGPFSPSCILTNYLVSEVSTLCTYIGKTDLYNAHVGDLGYVNHEMVCIYSLDIENSKIGLIRGILDTCPAVHPAGSRLFITSTFSASSHYELVKGDQVTAYFRTHHPLALLPRSQALKESLELVGRAVKPYPPGNLLLNEASYPRDEIAYGDIVFTWSSRNRFQQTVKAIRQDQGDISPVEEGVGYQVRLLKTGDGGIAFVTYMLGKKLFCPYTLLERGGTYTLTVRSICNGQLSYQGNSVVFMIGNNDIPSVIEPHVDAYSLRAGSQAVDDPDTDPEADTLANLSGAYGLWVND
jgi:hypothetical protein